MTSELSNFSARLRESICSTEQTGFSDGNFNALALELFVLQFSYNAAYRRICEARRVIPLTVSHWSQVPAVPAAAFKELALTCLPPEQRTHVFHSSGTTEQRPSRHFHSAESLGVYEASLWLGFRENLRFTNDDLRLVILTPSPKEAPHSSLVHMFEVVRRKLGAEKSVFVGRVTAGGAWSLDLGATLKALTDVSELGTRNPKLLLGTAFSFVHLLDFLGERDLRFELPPGSRVMETGGYKGRSRTLPKAELHALITERVGVPASHIVCEYGMSELGSQAYDSGASRSPGFAFRTFHFPPWTRAQIISPETGREVADGETGLIRVFDLANVFSVLAIQTEDLGIRRGDGFELLGRAARAEPRGCSLMAAEKS